MPRSLKRLLLTGFEPFGGVRVNPSWECIRGFDGEVWNGRVLVRAVRLPVAFGRAPARLREEIENFQPDVTVMFGVAAKRRAISIETQAVNVIGEEARDNDGAAPAGPIDPEGIPFGTSSLPFGRIEAALRAAGVPVEISGDAGSFLCNRVFYEACAVCDGPNGFIHVPPFEAIDEETLRRAVRIAAEAAIFEDVPVAVAQIAPRPGDVAANLSGIAMALEEANGARLLLLPELATSGLAIASPGKVALAADGPEIGGLQRRVDACGTALAFGFAEKLRGGFFNSAAILFPGRAPLVYRKRRLFGHDFTWASEGDGGGPWDTPLGRIGVAICHDVVYSDIAAESRGRDLVLMPTNWIGDSGPEDYLAAFAAPVLAADRTGEEDGIRFAGRGGLFRDGERVVAGEGVTRIEWKRLSI